MTDTELTAAVVQAYAADRNIDLSAEVATAFAEQFTQQEQLLAALENDQLLGDEMPERRHWRPDDDEDPYGAFLARCELGPTGSGPIDGLDVGIKDNIAVAGVPMTCGSPVLEEFHPATDATVVERIRAAGGTVVGKTNMDEFAFGGDASTMRFHLARNPHDKNRQPGSSSAGSAVAVGTGDADVALGSDTGGSVRIPAAWSGVVGLKPTRGLVSHHGFVQFSKTLDNIGQMGGSVEATARLTEAVAGRDSRDERTMSAKPGVEDTGGDYLKAVHTGKEDSISGMTVGIPEELFGRASDIESQVMAAVDELETLGVETKEVSIPHYELALPAWLAIGITEFGAYLRSYGVNYWQLSQTEPGFVNQLRRAVETDGDRLGNTVKSSLLFAEHLTQEHGNEFYVRGQATRELLANGVEELFEDVDVLVSPTIPMLAPEWGDPIEDVFGAISNTAPFNLTGHPAISLPCGFVDELPVGLQFIGPKFGEERLFRVSAAYEELDAFQSVASR